MEEVVQLLEDGGVVVLPTDTVYGIGCSAFDEDAIRRIFEMKGRTFRKPINVLVSSIEQAENFAEISDKERVLMEKYMPGAVTIILKKKASSGLPEVLTANSPTVGVRIPRHEKLLEIIRETGPLAVTSANLAGEEPAKSIEELDEKIKSSVDGVLDEGRVETGVPSTIVKIDEDGNVETLRRGSVVVEQ